MSTIESELKQIDEGLSELYVRAGIVDPDKQDNQQQNTNPTTTIQSPDAGTQTAPIAPGGQGDITPPKAIEGQAVADQQSQEDFKALYEAMEAKNSQLDKSYRELRSYTDRVAQENAKYRKQETNVSPVLQSPVTSTPEELQQLIVAADKAAEDYPEAVAPVIAILKKQQAIIDSLSGQIVPLRDTVIHDYEIRRDLDNHEKAKNHIEAIKAVHPDMEKIAESPDLMNWVNNHPAHDDVRRSLFPDVKRGEQGGNAKTINFYLTEFKKAIGINPQTIGQQVPVATQSWNAAARDSEGRLPGSGTGVIPGSNNTAGTRIAYSFLKKASQDPILWGKHQDELEKAFASGNIDWSV